MNSRTSPIEHASLFLTIPTAGRHPELLEEILSNAQLPPEQIVLVRTRHGATVPGGCLVVDDFGKPNIQRWWTRGIEESVARGASAVAVLNDDLRISVGTLQKLHDELRRSGATIATPSRPGLRLGVHKRPLIPYEPVIWGCLWVVNTAAGLRPDPRYVWWYGDNDLDIRARRDFSGVVSCDVEYEHYFPGEGTSSSPELTRQAEVDAQTFEAQYARLLLWSRWYRKLLRPRTKNRM